MLRASGARSATSGSVSAFSQKVFHLDVSALFNVIDPHGVAMRKLVLRIPLDVIQGSPTPDHPVTVESKLPVLDSHSPEDSTTSPEKVTLRFEPDVSCIASPAFDTSRYNLEPPLPLVNLSSLPVTDVNVHNEPASASGPYPARRTFTPLLLSPTSVIRTSYHTSPLTRNTQGPFANYPIISSGYSTPGFPPSESTIQALIRKIEGMDPGWLQKPADVEPGETKPRMTREELQARIDEICGVNSENRASPSSSRSSLTLSTSESCGSATSTYARPPPRTSKAAKLIASMSPSSFKSTVAGKFSSSSSSSCTCGKRKARSSAAPHKKSAMTTPKLKLLTLSALGRRGASSSRADADEKRDKPARKKLTGRQRQEKKAREAAMAAGAEEAGTSNVSQDGGGVAPALADPVVNWSYRGLL